MSPGVSIKSSAFIKPNVKPSTAPAPPANIFSNLFASLPKSSFAFPNAATASAAETATEPTANPTGPAALSAVPATLAPPFATFFKPGILDGLSGLIVCFFPISIFDVPRASGFTDVFGVFPAPLRPKPIIPPSPLTILVAVFIAKMIAAPKAAIATPRVIRKPFVQPPNLSFASLNIFFATPAKPSS